MFKWIENRTIWSFQHPLFMMVLALCILFFVCSLRKCLEACGALSCFGDSSFLLADSFFTLIVLPVITGIISTTLLNSVMAHRHRKHIKKCKERLHKAFHPVRCPHTRLHVVPRYKPLATLQADLDLDAKDIIEAVESSIDMRLRNLASTYSVSDNQQDKLVVECFPCEGIVRSYGYCIDRESPVTIVSTSSVREVGTGHFAYLLARYGGFNYISKERSYEIDERDSFHGNVAMLFTKSAATRAAFKEFLSDIKRHCQTSNQWAIYVLGTTREDITNIHFIYSSADSHKTLICEEQIEHISWLQWILKTYCHQWRLEREIKKMTKGEKSTIRIKTNTEAFLEKDGNSIIYAGAGKTHNALVIRIPFELSARDNRHILIAKAIAKTIKEIIGQEYIATSEKEIDFPSRKEYLLYERWHNLKAYFQKTGKPRVNNYGFRQINEVAMFIVFLIVAFEFIVLFGTFIAEPVIYMPLALPLVLTNLLTIGLHILSFCLISNAYHTRVNSMFRLSATDTLEGESKERIEDELARLPYPLADFLPKAYCTIFILSQLVTLIIPTAYYFCGSRGALTFLSFSFSFFIIIVNLLYLANKYQKLNIILNSTKHETN